MTECSFDAIIYREWAGDNFMLKRKIYDALLKWKKNKKQECLLVKGARQVGKTYIIREFGKNQYKSFIEINFYEHPDYKNIFEGDLSADEIYKRISLMVPNVKFIENDTLIFLDEIQHCPNARTAIKFLAIDDRFDVISSGSLLGLYYKDIVSVPVGYEKPVNMYSLDFEEFLWALGYGESTLKSLKDYFVSKEKIPDSIHEKFSKILREYMAVGGMPDVVNTFLRTDSFQDTFEKQTAILNEYENDIKKYAKITDRQKIRDCYYSIPRQLSKEYTKFQYKNIESHGSAKKYKESLEWLIDAGMIQKVWNISTPQIPLTGYEIPDQFKIYASDIGLATALFGFQTQAALVMNKLSGPAKGGIYENLIFDILSKREIPMNYYKREDSSMEIEFLIEQDCAVIPIEVKSKNGETPSFNQFIKKWNPPCAYKLTGTNIGKTENKITLPHYLAFLI